MDVEFWYNDHTVLFDKNSLIEFYPSVDFKLNRKLNAIFRSCIYTSVLLSVYSNNPKWISIIVIGAIITLLIYNYQLKNTTTNEKLQNITFNKGDCTAPTVDNPWMNYTMGDLLNVDENLIIKDRPLACSVIDNPSVKQLSEDAYMNNLYRDVDDVYGRNTSTRQFYTMPVTDIVSAQDDFANWLYKTGDTCKENTGNCLIYDDLRANRFIQVDPDTNPVNTDARMK
jgi:hypothetical protein